MRHRQATSQRPVLLALAIALVLSGPVARAAGRDLDIKASDGARLKGTYYATGRPGPGLLLLHQCNGDRRGWDALATELAHAGIHVLTFDYRGYGENEGPPLDTLASEAAEAVAKKWPADVDTALAALLRQPGVDRSRIAAGGASCGVHQAIQLARRHAEVRALVLLSGSPKALAEGRSFLAAHPALPIFAAASVDDGESPQIMRRIAALSKNPASRYVEIGGDAHGVPMFEREKTLPPAIVGWLSERLKVPPTQREAR